MPSIHFIRWIENLQGQSWELYWYDILNKGSIKTKVQMKQLSLLKTRKIPYIKGEYWLSKRKPNFYAKLRPLFEKTENEILQEIIQEIQPDIIHSFEMQSCCYPILKTMQKNPQIKWIYSCWGSDLFFYRQNPTDLKKIKNTLQRINMIHTDCLRDYKIAIECGYEGENGIIVPGGGGYKIEEFFSFKKSSQERKIILVKGYQHVFGRGLNIIKALEGIQEELQNFEVIVFGAHQTVIDYIVENKLSYKVFNRHELKNVEVLKLMGKSLIYIGNNISDGMPNTLLEAIVMGAFPIQSNPGGATAEIISNKVNGLLIENPESVAEIKALLVFALNNLAMIEKAGDVNRNIASKTLDYDLNKEKVINLYQNVLK